MYRLLCDKIIVEFQKFSEIKFKFVQIKKTNKIVTNKKFQGHLRFQLSIKIQFGKKLFNIASLISPANMKRFAVSLIINSFLISAIVANPVTENQSKNEDSIINGKVVGDDDGHFMVQLIVKLETEDFFNCGGALISNQTVLTAQHCVEQ